MKQVTEVIGGFRFDRITAFAGSQVFQMGLCLLFAGSLDAVTSFIYPQITQISADYLF
jgi:hypothetical protein